MVVDTPLVNKVCLLEKFPGKGGWTFARVPEIPANRKTPFGWVRVRGSIDSVPIRHYNLMPMGNGQLFLPVKAEIRKKINKQAGDPVHVLLYADDTVLEVPEDLLLCLKAEPAALAFFETLSESGRNQYIKWIYSSKNEDTRVARMVSTINRLLQKKKLNQNG